MEQTSEAGGLDQEPTGPNDQVSPTVVSRVARQSRLEGDRRIRLMSRRAGKYLDLLDERPVTVASEPCPHWHPGPCRGDYWGACSGAHLTGAEREALGAAHPWRVGA